MAKKNTGSKKGSAKKSAAKKPAAKKVETAKAVEEATKVEDATPETVEAVVKAESVEEVKEIITPEVEPEPTVVVVKDVGKPAAEDTWKDRVRIEAKELKEKMVALRTAINDHKVPLDQVPILNEQHAAMQAYYIILNRRLSS
jgi:hypothetical protein